jgi:poly-gamma-glutamate capsule biosynthesis protein CapA/YwtB (metallophosphatase superfamily)
MSNITMLKLGTPLRGLVRCTAAWVLLTAGYLPAVAQSDNDLVMTITLAGDVGLTQHTERPGFTAAFGARRRLTFVDAFAPVSLEINGDLNFINAETVISGRDDLAAVPKGRRCPSYFRSEPAGFGYLVSRGINLLSLANNHAMDYGEAGLRDTLRSVKDMQPLGLKAYAGAGLNREEASRPKRVSIKGALFAFGAIGIVGGGITRQRAGTRDAGLVDFDSDDDFSLVLRRLMATRADYRILSIHHGIEGRAVVDAEDIERWRQAAREGGLNLIAGHHAHVARGVEIYKGAVIFYGLGNFLHFGTGDLTKLDRCHSFGLLARVYVRRGADGVWRTRAVEAVPLTDTHIAPRRFTTIFEAHARIYVLNFLAQHLDDAASGAIGMRFTPQADGTGLYCFPDAPSDGGRIGALCADWQPSSPAPESLRAEIEHSCTVALPRVYPSACSSAAGWR